MSKRRLPKPIESSSKNLEHEAKALDQLLAIRSHQFKAVNAMSHGDDQIHQI
jgi:hypothetical protein